MGEIASYLRIHFSAIFSETWKFIKEHLTIDFFVLLVCFLIGYGVVPKQEINQFILSMFIGFAGLGCFVFIVFLYKSFMVPIHIYSKNNRDLGELRKEIKSIKIPILKIGHDESHHYEPYFGEPTLEELLASNQKIPRGTRTWRVCRIHVHNLSYDKKIENVKVKLTEVIPLPPQLRDKLPLHLHFEHDSETPYPKSKDINARDKEFVDVVQWNFHMADSKHDYYTICTADEVTTRFPIEDNDYKIKIEVTGGSAIGETKYFWFGMKDKDGNGKKLWLWSAE